MSIVPKLTIAAKLYAIFVALATAAVVLAAAAALKVSLPVGGVAACLYGLAVAGALIVGRAARPLATLGEAASAIAAGSSPNYIPHVDREDEVGALARSLVRLRDAMRRNDELGRVLADDTRAQARRQETIGSEILRFGEDIEVTLAELAAIAGQAIDASARVADRAVQVSARTRDAEAASGEASSHVRDIASAADELSASVMEIDRQVTQSTSIVGRAVDEAARTYAAVNELDQAAGRIGNVVKLITAIAEQTNLLALNATIEAARAGESGRGFSVVANEVKALAGQTAKATKEISGHIAAMQQATGRSVQAIAAIRGTIEDLGEISTAIAVAVTQQGAATQEIARSADTAAKRTGDTAAEVGRASEAGDEADADAAAIRHTADALSALAGRMRTQIDGFLAHLHAA
jgi:methyl-accepting chemotaxis protein